jgi:16S rRNA (uracil1498-N3)-methyltransferase
MVETERSVVRLAERAAGRLDRWREVAVQAARQSGRGDVTEIDGPLALATALAEIEPRARVRVVLAPGADSALLEVVSDAPRDALVALLIGPEGGLTDGELELCERHGFGRARFGRLVLRTETAATAALGALVAHRDSRGL